MFTVFFGVLTFVAVYASVGAGHWGPAVLAGVLFLVWLMMVHEERKDRRAWYNFRDYWADGGDGKRRRR